MIGFFILATFVSSFLGGLIGLRYKDKFHLVLGFTAGIMLGVVAFNLLPEIYSMAADYDIDPVIPMVFLIIGFLSFHAVEKSLAIHCCPHKEEYRPHHHPVIGLVSAVALSIHAFMDGLGVGLGFQTSTNLGMIIALAVIAHNFCDGLNSVSLMLVHKNSERRAVLVLLLEALSPTLGIFSTFFFSLPVWWLIFYLGFFSGFLLYMSTSDILPEAHSRYPSRGAILMTIIGVVFIFMVTKIVY